MLPGAEDARERYLSRRAWQPGGGKKPAGLRGGWLVMMAREYIDASRRWSRDGATPIAGCLWGEPLPCREEDLVWQGSLGWEEYPAVLPTG